MSKKIKKLIEQVFLGIFLGGLCFFMLVEYANLNLRTAFIDASVSVAILLILTTLSLNVLKSALQNKLQITSLFISALSLSLAWMYLSKTLLLELIQNTDYQEFLITSLPWRAFIGLFAISSMLIIGLLKNQQKDQLETKEREVESERRRKEAELIELRQQLQPHFLFNSLNSISALIQIDGNKAQSMIQNLASFFRGSLRSEKRTLIELSEEMKHIELYLSIEEVRFGHRLKVNLDIEEKALAAKIPALILQPLIENAIKFGLYGTIDKVEINCKASLKDKYLNFKIDNPFDEDEESKEGTSFGLTSIQRRLYLLFGRNDLLTIRNANKIFEVELRIPQID